MLTFEGVLGIGGQAPQWAAKLLFRVDYAKLNLHVDSHNGGSIVVYIPDLIEKLRPPHRMDARELMPALFADVAGQGDSSGLSWLSEVAQGLIGPGAFPRMRIIAQGVSGMKYLRRCENADFSPVGAIVIDLSNADLSDIVFVATDFAPANIAGANLARTTFEGCRFGQKQLAGQRLDGVRLRRQTWENLDLTGASLDGAQLDDYGTFVKCDFTRAKLKNAQVNMVAFVECKFNNAVLDGIRGPHGWFIGCDFTDATFTDANLEGPNFGSSTLNRTSFKNATLAGAYFTKFPERQDAYGPPNLIDADFDNTDLTRADFTGMNLAGKVRHARPPRFGAGTDRRTRLVGATFNASFLGNDCSYIDASGARILIDANLKVEKFKAIHAIFPVLDFANLDLTDADFTSAYLKQAKFGNCRLTDAVFNQAILEGADFTSALLTGAKFKGATLTSANFTQAWLEGGEFENAVLSGTNFSSAMLAQVSFRAIQGRSLAGVVFSNACLVSADFVGVISSHVGSAFTTFSAACLAGADFTGAQLPDVVLTNVQVAAEAGSIKASHRAWTRNKQYTYEKTKLPPTCTGPQTTCADGKSGPCTAAQLVGKPVGAKWPE